VLRLFKSAGPLGFFSLLVYTILLRAFQLFQNQASLIDAEKPAPLFELMLNGINSLGWHHPVTFFVLSVLLTLAQAVLINNLLERHKVFMRPYWMPAFGYVLMVSILPETAIFSPALVANTFLILIFSRLFGTFRRERCDRDLFDIGFSLALAMLFYPPSFVWLVFIVIALILLRPLRLREYFIVLIGLLNLYFLSWVVNFSFGLGYPLYQHFLSLFNIHWVWELKLNWLMMIQIAILLITAFAGWFSLQSQFNTFTIQIRSFLNLLVLFTVIAIISLLWADAITLDKFLPAMIPLSVYLVKTLRDLRWPLLAEFIHLFLLAGTFYREFLI
jgi:hypothetical protein